MNKLKLGDRKHLEIIALCNKILGHMKRPQPRCDQLTLDIALKLIEEIKNEKE